MDLSDYEARMQVRPTIASDEIVATLMSPGATGAVGPTGTALGTITLGDGGVDGATGAIALQLDAVETDLIPAGKYFYDLEMVPSDGKVKRLLQGRFIVSGEVTR